MRVIEESTLIDLPAAVYWALRLDTNFDRFCAEAEKCTFTLVSLTHSTDALGPAVAVETEMAFDEPPVPAAVVALVGSKRFALVNKARWHLERHGRAARMARSGATGRRR